MLEARSEKSLRGIAYWQTAARLTASSWRDMFARGAIASNLAAGLTIALVALPLNLALALACGLPASAGLITGAVAGALGALLGGSRLQVTGPEVALAPLTLFIVSEHGVSGLFVAVFLCGLFQIVFGLLRFGEIVRLIPSPVIVGFLTAVGLLVFDSQLPRLFGLPREFSTIHEALNTTALSQIHVEALAVGAVALVTIVVGARFLPRIPAPLLGLAVATLLAFALPNVPSVDPLPRGFPHPSLPDFASLNLGHLIPEAFALALLASIDSLLCAASVDARIGGARTRNDQELVAQGIANLASACLGGMPVAAAIVRSMAAIEAKASSRLAPLSQAVFLALVLLVFAPFVSYVPLVALAAILLVVGYRLIDVRSLKRLWQRDRVEAVIALATAVTILFTDFVGGVALGSVLALMRFAYLMRPSLTAHVAERDETSHHVRLQGPLFFANQTTLDALFEPHLGAHRLCVDLSGVSFADSTGASALRLALERLVGGGQSVVLTRLPAHSTWLRAELVDHRPSRIVLRLDAPELETSNETSKRLVAVNRETRKSQLSFEAHELALRAQLPTPGAE